MGAIAKITDNKNLLLLEKYFGEVKRPYQSFYIPKIQAEKRQIAEAKLKQFLRHHKINEGLADDLFKQKRVQVDKKGGIWFYSDEGHSEAVQYTLDSEKNYKAKYYGKPDPPFIDSYNNGGRVTVYTDFLSFLRTNGKKVLRGRPRLSLVLRGLEEKSLHIFLATRPQIKSLEFVEPESKGQQAEKDFIERQKKQLEPFNISVRTLSMEKSIQRRRGLSIEF